MNTKAEPTGGDGARSEAVEQAAQERRVEARWQWLRGAPARGFVSIIGGLLIWEFVGRVIMTNPLFFAPFSDVVAAAIRLTAEGVLIHDFIVTTQEVIYGLGLATVVGIGLGMFIGISPLVRDFVNPWLGALYSTPLAALAPLFLLWFGIGQASKVAVVFVSALFPIVINSAAGIANADQNHIDVARAFGFPRVSIFRKILLPSALAFIATGIRLGVGRALVGAVVAELFGAQAGLGYRILVSGQAFKTDELLAGVLVLAITGVVALNLVGRLERRLAPWREEVEL